MEANNDRDRKAELIVDAFEEYQEIIKANPQLVGNLSFEGYLNFSYRDFFANERYNQFEQVLEAIEKRKN